MCPPGRAYLPPDASAISHTPYSIQCIGYQPHGCIVYQAHECIGGQPYGCIGYAITITNTMIVSPFGTARRTPAMPRRTYLTAISHTLHTAISHTTSEGLSVLNLEG